MAVFIVIRLDPNDGSSAPKFISNIVNGQLQLAATFADLTYKWDVASIDSDAANALAEAIYNSRKLVEGSEELTGARVYADEVEII